MERDDGRPDLVGRTSARLLAAGVERRDRLAALQLLAILDASTDQAGRIRRPLDDLAAEFELAPLSVIRSLDHLERAGAVERDGSAVVLLGTGPEGLGGMQLAEFLEDVQASFDGGPAAPVRSTTWVARAGVALVAATAALTIVTIAPSTPTAVERPQVAAAPTTALDRTPAFTATDEAPVATVDEPAPAADVAIDDGEPAPEFTATADTAIASAGTCPTGSPVADVVAGVLRITNATTADLVVTALTVGGTRLRAPITVAAGVTVERDVAAFTIATADTTIDEWEWANPMVVRTCPS